MDQAIVAIAEKTSSRRACSQSMVLSPLPVRFVTYWRFTWRRWVAVQTIGRCIHPVAPMSGGLILGTIHRPPSICVVRT